METTVRMETCDKCGRRFTFSIGRIVCLPRPSDPDTWAAVLWGHAGCFPSGDNCHTRDEWQHIAESNHPPFTWLEMF